MNLHGLANNGIVKKLNASPYLFFDSASTTPCCESALELMKRFALEEYGNPSSSHAMGQAAAQAISESRRALAQVFEVQPEQIVFTGSGSESDNLAIYGVVLSVLARRIQEKSSAPPPKVLVSATEHAAVRKSAESLRDLGCEVELIPVDRKGQIDLPRFLAQLTPNTALVSIHQVNNIVGALHPIEDLARMAKNKVPDLIFHSDCVQAFGKVPPPRSGSSVDLASISAHKIQGPKGVGALVILNRELLQDGARPLRPMIWGGDQEGGFRSGTQSAGLIAGFGAAAREALEHREEFIAHCTRLRRRFKDILSDDERISMNSSDDPLLNLPHIVSLSAPGFPGSLIAQMLEKRGCLISTGSACSAGKSGPDPVLTAMKLDASSRMGALRISFGFEHDLEDVEHLARSLRESLDEFEHLMRPEKNHA